MEYLIPILFYGIPSASFVFFLISLFRYRAVKRTYKEGIENLDLSDFKKRKILFIISTVIFGVLAAILIGLTILLYLAISFM